MKKIVLFLFTIMVSIFLGISDVLSNEIENESNHDIPSESITNNVSSDRNPKTKLSNSLDEYIFGDQQPFPFIAGFGKNAAH